MILVNLPEHKYKNIICILLFELSCFVFAGASANFRRRILLMNIEAKAVKGTADSES